MHMVDFCRPGHIVCVCARMCACVCVHACVRVHDMDTYMCLCGHSTTQPVIPYQKRVKVVQGCF